MHGKTHDHDHDSLTRLIAKVLRELLASEAFASYADLVEALKSRLARLRIAWRSDDITAAVRLVESNRDLLEPVERIKEMPPTDPPAIAPAEAAARLEAIRTRAGIANPIKPMPRAQLITRRQAECRRALAMVLEEIRATAARCDALERDP